MNCLRAFTVACTVVLLSSFGATAQWVQTNGPYGGTVRCFAVSGPNLFAGTGGGVFLTTNNGTGWTPVNAGLTNPAVNALVTSGTNLIAGTSGGVFLSTNSGTSWTAVNTGLTNTDVRALAASGANIFAGTYGGGIFLSTNGGTSWTAVNTGLTNLSVNAFATNDTNIFAGTYGGVFVTTNNGTSWTAINTGLTRTDVLALCTSPGGAGGTNLFAGTSGGGVFLSTNNGTTWTAANTGMTGNTGYTTWVFAFATSPNGAGGTNLFAGTPLGVYLTTNNGTSWTAVNTGLMNTTVLALAASDTNLFAGTYGGVFLSTNNGTNWTAANTGMTSTTVFALAASSNGAGGTNLFAGTYGGGVFLSSNNGLSWTPARTGLTSTYVYALATSPNGAGGTNLFAGTRTGVFLSTNDGTSWTAVNTGLTNASVYALATIGTNLFAGTHGGVFLSTNNGTSWTSANMGLTSADTIVRALVTSGTNVFAGIFGRGVFLSTNSGTSWTSANTGLTSIYVYAFATSPDGAGGTNIFAGTSGGVFLSTNSGTSWTAVNTGLTSTAVSALATSPNGAGGTNIFAGTSGGVFLSTDNGTSWTAVNTGLTSTGVRSLAASGTNLFAGTYEGGVWRLAVIKPSLPVPVLISVKDVPFDQGGKVQLVWQASPLDTNVSKLPYYSIWRAAPQSTQQSTVMKNSSDGSNMQLTAKKTRIIETASGTLAWEWLANRPAHRDSLYSYTAWTFNDSMAGNYAKEYFIVSAQTNDINVFYDSNIDSGYSVDNLSPLPPQNLVASVVSGKVVLHWSPNIESDLKDYFVYRSDSAISDSDNIAPYHTTSDTSYTDTNPIAGGTAYYVIRAEDIHGNLSGISKQAIVTGEGPSNRPLYSVSTAQLTFWGVEIGTTKKDSVRISNPGTDTLKISAISSTDQSFTFAPSTIRLAPTASAYLVITFAPQDTSDESGFIILTHNAEGSPDSIAVVGKGILTVVDGRPPVPTEYGLTQNYPNPFNPTTTINYQLPRRGHVVLKVYDALGREVTTLVNGERSAGYHSAVFDGSDLPSGIYLYRIEAGTYQSTMKLMLVK